MENLKIKVINLTKMLLPTCAVIGSAGLDLRANIPEPITLDPMARALIPAGIKIALPVGYCAMICPRSGLAIKHGITVLNAPGIVDFGYTNEVCVILVNLSNEPFTIEPDDRIAQMVIVQHETTEWEPVNQLEKTERGDGGFGHSGMK